MYPHWLQYLRYQAALLQWVGRFSQIYSAKYWKKRIAQILGEENVINARKTFTGVVHGISLKFSIEQEVIWADVEAHDRGTIIGYAWAVKLAAKFRDTITWLNLRQLVLVPL